jgi:acetyl-CoA carboxylase biotin carboxyl carrier protein
MKKAKKSTWLDRVEQIAQVLEGSSVSELELVEGDTEIIIRRSTGMVLTSIAATQPRLIAAPGAAPAAPARQEDTSIPVTSPITGVFYSAASPTTPPFVNIGEVVSIGQVVALVEAMKVFNEITSEVAGRLIRMVAKNGDVVQKGDVLMRLEPLT